MGDRFLEGAGWRHHRKAPALGGTSWQDPASKHALAYRAATVRGCEMECVEQWSGNQRMASGSDSLAHPYGTIFCRLFGRALESEQIAGGQREARSPRLPGDETSEPWRDDRSHCSDRASVAPAGAMINRRQTRGLTPPAISCRRSAAYLHLFHQPLTFGALNRRPGNSAGVRQTR